MKDIFKEYKFPYTQNPLDIIDNKYYYKLFYKFYSIHNADTLRDIELFNNMEY